MLEGGGDRQNDIRVLNRLVKELIHAHHHFQLVERFFHLVAVEVLGKRVLTGHPQHADRGIVGVQNALRSLVQVERAVRVLALFAAIADKLAHRA